MQNKKTIGLVIGFVAVAVISFYAGVSYTNGKNSGSTAQATAGTNTRGNFGGGQKGGRGGGIFGKVVAKDANSITVELSAPGQGSGADTTSTTGTGSKIVFYTDQTTVMKTTTGSANDIVVGSQVSINGSANTDGSVTAQTISLRPNIPSGPKQ